MMHFVRSAIVPIVFAAISVACPYGLLSQTSAPPEFVEDRAPGSNRKAELPNSGLPDDVESTSRGSSYVPLDSWVYAALDRLASFGTIPSQISGLRPWTRAECLRQTHEARRHLPRAGGSGADPAGEASRLVEALELELEEPVGNSGFEVTSIYSRNGVIAGEALNDSYHFGQTWSNDYGRPFGRGWNSYEGFTTRAWSGRYFTYVSGELQHSPGRPEQPLAVRDTISLLDGIPLPPAERQQAVTRFRLLDAYVGARVGNIELSAGKQTLWWGPTYDAPLSFSNNAEPTKNLRVSTVHPFRLGGVLRHLGAIRGEFVIGKLGGHQFTWRPWFNAQKISFKLTRNLEMGFTRWSIFWGVGHPITVRSFVRNFTSASSPFEGVDPGDRKGGFDFRYRVPGLRNWVTLYSDSYSDDDPSPLAAPRRAAINPGILFTRIPGIPKMDLRVEAPSTTPMGGDRGGNFIYYNNQYRSGNTNYGYLLGNSVGRDGRAIQVWTRNWFSPRSKIELGFRQMKGGAGFLPGGSTQSGTMMRLTAPVAKSVYAEMFLQYERFSVPVLGQPQRNVSGWMQITWEPHLQFMKRTPHN